MAKTYVVKLEIDGVSESVSSINDLETAVADLELQLKKADLGSEEFLSLSKQIKQAKTEIDSFNPKQKAKEFDSFGKGVSGSFDVARNAMSLFGVQGSELAGLITKSQKAMRIAYDLTEKAQEGLGKSTEQSGDKAVQSTKGLIGGFKNLVKGVKLGGKAMKAAIASTGIGLLVVAVGLLVEYWDDIKVLVNGVSSEQKKLNKEAADNVKTAKEGLDTISAQENILKLQGKSEREIRDMKIAQTDELITASKIQLDTMEATKKAQVEAAQRNKNILQGILAFMTLPITSLLVAVDALTYGLEWMGVIDEGTTLVDDFTGGIAEMLFDPEETAKKGDADIEAAKKSLEKLENTRAGFLVQSQSEDQAAYEKRKALSDKELLEEKARIAEKAEALRLANLAYQAEVVSDAEKLRLINQEIAVLLLEDEFDKAEKILEQQKTNDLLAVKNLTNRFELEWAIEQKYDALSTELTKTKAASDKAIAKEVADAEKSIQDAKINNIANGFKLLSQIAGKSKAAQAISIIGENAVGIAKQIISTRAANAAALATPQAIASSGTAAVPVIAANNISLGLGIASSAAATAKALSALKEGGDTGGGGNDGGGGGGGAPNLGTPEETANIDFSFLGDGDVSEVGQTAPVQAYVIGSDVTSSQEASQVIKDQSTL